MALEELSDEYVEESAMQIEDFLSRSLPVKSVTPVTADEVAARASPNSDPARRLDKYQVYYRLTIAPLEEVEVCETFGEVESHIRDMLESMERNSDAPDTLVALTNDAKPGRKIIIYLISTL